MGEMKGFYFYLAKCSVASPMTPTSVTFQQHSPDCMGESHFGQGEVAGWLAAWMAGLPMHATSPVAARMQPSEHLLTSSLIGIFKAPTLAFGQSVNGPAHGNVHRLFV